jgi:hypothetical protein
VPSLAHHEYETLLRDLQAWVDHLIIRFALDVRTIPPCWTEHNAMVETLTALRDFERGCYVGNPPPTAAIDWIRTLRDTVTYLKEVAAVTQCTGRLHRAGASSSHRGRNLEAMDR